MAAGGILVSRLLQILCQVQFGLSRSFNADAARLPWFNDAAAAFQPVETSENDKEHGSLQKCQKPSQLQGTLSRVLLSL